MNIAWFKREDCQDVSYLSCFVDDAPGVTYTYSYTATLNGVGRMRTYESMMVTSCPFFQNENASIGCIQCIEQALCPCDWHTAIERRRKSVSKGILLMLELASLRMSFWGGG